MVCSVPLPYYKHFMIVSGITFFIVRGCMAIYKRCWESEEITTIQLEELSGHIINQDRIETLAKEEPIDTNSV